MKKKIAGIILAAILILPFTAGTTLAATCNGHVGITVYENVNYGGASLTFCASSSSVGWSNLDRYGWNDRISSYKVVNGSGKTTRLYPDINYGGSPYYLTSTGTAYVPDVGIYWQSHWGDGFNDQASSIKQY